MIIFDLDHTVIDSSHRQATLSCGSLDLANWIKNNTPENIAQDKLLPLARYWKTERAKGTTIGVCTARVLQDADYQFLADNGLDCDFILSRKLGDNSGDGILKEKLLKQYSKKINMPFDEFTKSITGFFDDNQLVLNKLKELNVKAYNALDVNKMLHWIDYK